MKRRKYRKKKPKLYKLSALIAAVAIIIQAIYPIIPFLPSFGEKKSVVFANDDILATGETEKVMFQNTNPAFKVEFGNKEQANKPFVRFQAIGSGDNPFAKEKNETIVQGVLRRLSSAIYGDKERGIEFSMREAGISKPSAQSSVLSGEATSEPETSKLENQNTNQNGNALDSRRSLPPVLTGDGKDNVNSDNNKINSLTKRNLIDNLTEKAVGGWEKANDSTQPPVPSGQERDPSLRPDSGQANAAEAGAQDDSVLEAQAELEAEQRILDMLEEQLDRMIKDADWKPTPVVDVDKKREELRKQILDDLIKAQPVAAPTEISQTYSSDTNDKKKDIIKNPNVVAGVDTEYQIMESKGLKEEIVIKSSEGFTRECMEKMINSAQGSGLEAGGNANQEPGTWNLEPTEQNCSLPKNEYTFDLKLDPGVVMKHAIGTTNSQPHGITYFTDEEDNYLFHFLPLYVYDSAGVKTNNVRLEINDAQGSKLQAPGNSAQEPTAMSLEQSYTMKVIVDLTWLLDPTRVFPIRVDPSIVHDTEAEFDAGNALNRVESLSDPKVDIKDSMILANYGNGADSACTVSSGTTNLNTGSCAGRGTADAINTTVSANTSSGQNQITVASVSGLAAGDEILIINLMGTSGNYANVGKYETKRISSINSNTLNLNSNLANSYDGTTQKIMVQRVPNYTTVTVNNGTILTADAWNGTKNGVIFFRATGTVTNGGTIDMNSKGFRGGANDTSGPEGYSGRSASGGGTGGTGGTGGYWDACLGNVAPTAGGNGSNNAGGGGGGGGWYTGASGGSGGSRGGGGGGGSGNNGGGLGGQANGASGNATFSNQLISGGGGGGGGSSYSALTNPSNLTNNLIIMGGGSAGGASGGTGGGVNSPGSAGNPYSTNTGNLGGGIIYISGRSLTLSGTLRANGGNGGNGTAGSFSSCDLGYSECGGGGGGGNGGNGAAGGTIILKGISVTLGTVTGSGGSGGSAGSGGNGNSIGGNGGAGSAGSTGGNGVIGVYYLTSFSGSSTPTATTQKMTNSNYNYGEYNSSVLDLTSGVSLIDSLVWTENGVQTGDGETEYSSTNLVAEWDFNENSGTSADDSSVNSHTGTLNGFSDTSGQDVAVMSGWTTNNSRWPRSAPEALMFDGASDYVNVTDAAALKPASYITMDSWVKTGSVNTYIIHKFNTGTPFQGYGLITDANGKLSCWVGGNAWTAGTTTITDNNWHHTACTYDGTNAKVYVDGKLENSQAQTASLSYAIDLRIGVYNAASGYFKGVIDSVHIYSRALGADEILSNYQAGNIEFQTRTGTDSTPDDGSWEEWRPVTSETALASMDADQANWSWDATATYMPQNKSDESNIKMEGSGSMKQIIGAPQDSDANVVGLWHMDETGGTGAYIKDTSGNANNGTPTGTSVVDGIYGKARSHNGSSDYISVPEHASLDLTTAGTVEFWFKRPTIGTNMHFGKWDGNSNQRSYLLQIYTDNKIYFNASSDGAGSAYFTSTNTFTDTGWNYLAGVYNGSNLKVYLNGSEVSGSTTGSVPASLYNSSATVGTRYYSSSYQYSNGIIDEARISNSARSAEEIAEAYRMGRDHRIAKTISSADLTTKTKLPFWLAGERVGNYLEATAGESALADNQADANTVGLYHLEEAAGSGAYIQDESSSGNDGTPTGATFVNGRIGKARSFDGSNDYVDLGTGASFDFGNDGPFTISGWVKPTTLVDYAGFVSKVVAGRGGTYSYMTAFHANGRLTAYNTTTLAWPDICPAGSVANGSWYHVAYAFDGTNITGYVNGVKCGSAAFDYTDNTAHNVYIGSWYSVATAYDFNGLLDEVRVDNTARSASDIRQAYEIGKRTHPITIDFQAKLDSGNLIADTSDLSFTVDARPYISTTNQAENLYMGDKIIVKENYDGTEYIAQGTVTAVTTASGATTVAAWDTGSTAPAAGFTANAQVFKWQREWMDVTGPIDSQKNAIVQLTLRCTDGSEGRTVYLDDFRSGGEYLSTSPETTDVTSTDQRYMQYRAIFSTTDTTVTPYLSGVTVNYTAGPTKAQLMRHGKYVSGGVEVWWGGW